MLRGVLRVLRPGGEFYFSDVYADRRVAQRISANAVLRFAVLYAAF